MLFFLMIFVLLFLELLRYFSLAKYFWLQNENDILIMDVPFPRYRFFENWLAFDDVSASNVFRNHGTVAFDSRYSLIAVFDHGAGFKGSFTKSQRMLVPPMLLKWDI